MGQYLEYLTIDFFGVPLDESLSIPKRFLYVNLNHCLWIELLQMNNKSMRVAKFIHFVSWSIFLPFIYIASIFIFWFLIILLSVSISNQAFLVIGFIHYNYVIFITIILFFVNIWLNVS